MLRLRVSQSALPSTGTGRWRNLAAGGLLFAATAAVVFWQNMHLVVLWDLSYVLDTAMRIAQGQMPYRDFPLAHAPLTFLLQAAIVRLTGRAFFHHVVYAAAAGGLGTVLTWRILLHTLRGRVENAWWLSVLLTAPLCVLGVYCIFPHPSYDCDCALAILAAILLLVQLTPDAGSARCAATPMRCFAAGAALTVPLFFKQNIGLPLLAIAAAALMLAFCARLVSRLQANLSSGMVSEESASPSPRPTGEPGIVALLAILAGMAAALAFAAILLHFTAGIGNYLHWTIAFAAQRRMPGIAAMVDVYREPMLQWMLPCIAAGLVLLKTMRGGKPWREWLGLALLSAPFLWTLFSLYLYDDADERGDALLALWPALLIVAAALTLWNLRQGIKLRALMPLIVLATVNGTLMSQQLWGSTYAIWPLLVILIAEAIAFVGHAPDARDAKRSGRLAMALAAVVAVTLLVCGGAYTLSEERLAYVQRPDGPLLHSSVPQLAGVSASGNYLPEFEELLAYAAANIPANDGLILIPGEDPFYFVTGRVPQFPVLLFDPATQPYSPAELRRLARERRIRWLIVKRDLQMNEDPTPQRDATLRALLQDFALAKTLRGYDVYRLRS